jgi:hypothetical protein
LFAKYNGGSKGILNFLMNMQTLGLFVQNFSGQHTKLPRKTIEVSSNAIAMGTFG